MNRSMKFKNINEVSETSNYKFLTWDTDTKAISFKNNISSGSGGNTIINGVQQEYVDTKLSELRSIVDDKVNNEAITQIYQDFNGRIDFINQTIDENSQNLGTRIDTVEGDISSINTTLPQKANVSTVNNMQSTLTNAINAKANNTAVTELFTRVVSLEGMTATNGGSISTLNSDVITINNTLTNKADKWVENGVIGIVQSMSGIDTRLTTVENAYTSKNYVDGQITIINNTISGLPTTSNIDGKLDKTTFDASYNGLLTTINTLPTKTLIDASLNLKVDTTTFNTLSTTVSGHTSSINTINTTLANKVDTTTYNTYTSGATTAINNKADLSTVTTLSTTVSGKADKSYVDTALANKADSSTVTLLTNSINNKVEKTSFDTLSTTVNALPTKAYVDSLVIPLPPYYEYTTGSGFVCTPSYTIFTDIALTNFPVFNTTKYQMIMNFCFFPNNTSTLNQIIEVYFKIVLPNNTESTDSLTVSPYNSTLLPACLRTADFYSTVSSGVGIPANAIFYKPAAYLMNNLKLRTYMRIRNATNVAFPAVSMAVSFIPVLSY